MLDALYQQEIIELSRKSRARGRLDAPDASARVDNPLCGDRVTIDLALDKGRITAIGHR
ncbi:MAG: iron-sulfur cluster assembly scaffold protein, partial [Proteobacteria bacterium]|nr:iron-sulfur cluster assembly scaffold protein [Pseudomonadota bacterium]